jgi:uncharacterized membrane protein
MLSHWGLVNLVNLDTLSYLDPKLGSVHGEPVIMIARPQSQTISQTGIIAAVVQLFFALRISVLTRGNLFVLLPLGLCILFGLGGATAVVSDVMVCHAIFVINNRPLDRRSF